MNNRDTLVQANYHLNKRIEEMMDQMDAMRDAGDSIIRKCGEFEIFKNFIKKSINLFYSYFNIEDLDAGQYCFTFDEELITTEYCNKFIELINEVVYLNGKNKTDGKGRYRKART